MTIFTDKSVSANVINPGDYWSNPNRDSAFMHMLYERVKLKLISEIWWVSKYISAGVFICPYFTPIVSILTLIYAASNVWLNRHILGAMSERKSDCYFR